MHNNTKFIKEQGIKSPYFLAIVENNKDPNHIGRVQARIIGLHTEIKIEGTLEGIETESLLWVNPVLPISGGITGIGEFPNAPRQGDMVRIFFIDWPEAQLPYYDGIIAGGRRVQADTSIGFNDPDGKYPRTDRIPNDPDSLSYGDAPFTKDESRKDLGLTYFDVIRNDIDDDNSGSIQGAFGNDTWSETGPSSQPEGDLNHVIAKPARNYTSDNDHYKIGYVSEIDSTPEKEGVRTYYAPSASYHEVSAGGEESIRMKGGRKHVVFDQDRLQVKGFQNIVIEGNQYVLVQTDKFQEIIGDLDEKITNMRQEIDDLKRVEANTVTHHVNRHNLDDDGNTRKVNNLLLCPFTGSAHSTQNKTFCS